jgi:MFS family permease
VTTRPDTTGLPPSEIRARWGLLAAGATLMAISSGVWYTASVFFVALLREFQADYATTAGIFSLFTLLYGVFGVLAGSLLDRLGPRRVILIGGTILPLAHVASALSTNLWQLYLTHGVLTPLGLSFAGYVPVSVLMTHTFRSQRGLALGIASAGVGVGILAIVPLAQLVIDHAGWRVAYFVMAALAACVTLPVAIWALRGTPESGAPAAGPGRSAGPTGNRGGWTLPRALRSREFWLVGATFVFLNSATQLILTHHVAHLVEAGQSKMLVAWIVGLIGLVSIPGKIGWGFLSDRQWLEWIYVWGGTGIVAGIFALLAIGPETAAWALAVYAILMGVGYSVSPALSPIMSGRFFGGASFGLIFGALNTLYQLGGAAGIWLAGYAHDRTGSYRVAFLASILCVLLSAGCAWLAAPRRRPAAGC